jgi:AraC family transcriptional regulator of arabinose operon
VLDVSAAVARERPAVTCGDIVYPPGSTYGPLVHPSVELAFVHRGTMAFWVDGVRFDAGPGTVSLLLPGRRCRFEFSRTQETHHSWVHLWSRGAYAPELLERLATLPRTIRLSSTLTRELRELIELGSSRLPSRDEIELLGAHRLLYQYVGEAELVLGGRGGDHGPVERALQHVDDHLGDPLDLPALAEAAAVSPSHLIRLFRDELGTTPGRYLWRRRVERGVELLEATGLSIDEVARRCGFRTSHHFSRRIRAATGLPPAALRRRAHARGGD